MTKLPIVAALLTGIAPAGVASASIIKVDYTGTVTDVSDSGDHSSGYIIGENITGEMVLSLPDTPQRSYYSGLPAFDDYDGTGSSAINGETISGLGFINNRTINGFESISFDVTQMIGDVQFAEGLYFQGYGSAPLLGSLQNLPTDLTAIESYLENPPYTLNGHIYVNAPGTHVSDIDWNVQSVEISAVTETPIPAALPLFISALGSFGFVGWQHRKRATR